MTRFPRIKVGHLRRSKHVVLGLILLDILAGVILLRIGMPSLHPVLAPRHPRMASRRLEQLLNARQRRRQGIALHPRPLDYRCSLDSSGGWDYVCRAGTNEIGYYDVSATTTTRQSVIETHGNQVEQVARP